MKRVLALLSVVCALFLLSACHYDVNLSVEASAELTYDNGDLIRIDPVLFEGFHQKHLTDYDLEDIFLGLTRNVNPDFRTAILHLALYDEIGNKFLREEHYGVVYNSRTGHYDFADMDTYYD